MPESVEPIMSRATPSSAFIALRSMPCASSVAPSCFIASIAPLGRMWPTAASTTELLMIVWPFSMAYRWMAVLATPRANTGIFSMRRRASSVHAMVYSACWSIGGTYFLLETITWQSTMRNRFSALEPMSMSSSLCTPIRPTISIQGFSRRTYPPDHALRDAADDAVLHGAHAQGPHDDEVVGVGVDVFNEDFEVPALQRSAFDRDVRFGCLLVHDVEVGVGDDLQASGDQ